MQFCVTSVEIGTSTIVETPMLDVDVFVKLEMSVLTRSSSLCVRVGRSFVPPSVGPGFSTRCEVDEEEYEDEKEGGGAGFGEVSRDG